ncbi:MAG: class I SAM-dependent methyltransferase [Chlamydiales bacterium]|nr:class I SAM-dependent methyltransferase [Chlamydiales bacterium]
MQHTKKKSTSWESASDWYDQIVGDSGHTYHTEVILPKLLSMMQLSDTSALLDVGCGQGVLERAIPKNTRYCGIDISKSLIQEATNKAKSKLHQFMVQDSTLPFSLHCKFSHAAIVLALQNMANIPAVFQNISTHLEEKGSLFLVLNHPCFRIPRQSSWGEDVEKKLQYRRIDRYMSPLEIPIQINPSKKEKSANLISFHHSLSDISLFLFQNGFLIEKIEEWCSNKQSDGKKAKMENRARKEFPLFLTVQATKK